MDSKHEVERLDQELQKVKLEVSSFLFMIVSRLSG